MLVYSSVLLSVNLVKETGSAAENDWSAGVSLMTYLRASLSSPTSILSACWLMFQKSSGML